MPSEMIEFFREGDLAPRDFRESDNELIVDYMYRSSPDYLDSLGIDLKKMPSEQAYRDFITSVASLPVAEQRFMIMVKGESAIGFLLVNEMTIGRSALAHWHIFEASQRGHGLAPILAQPAIAIIVERFKLTNLFAKIPISNLGSIKAIEKMGARFVADEVISGPFLKSEMPAKCFELFPRLRDEAKAPRK